MCEAIAKLTNEQCKKRSEYWVQRGELNISVCHTHLVPTVRRYAVMPASEHVRHDSPIVVKMRKDKRYIP